MRRRQLPRVGRAIAAHSRRPELSGPWAPRCWAEKFSSCHIATRGSAILSQRLPTHRRVLAALIRKVGQTSGVTQRCLNPGFSERLGVRDARDRKVTLRAPNDTHGAIRPELTVHFETPCRRHCAIQSGLMKMPQFFESI
jgi:hypothetical protein